MAQNNTSNSVSSYEYKTQYRIYTSKQNFEKHAEFLLLGNRKNSHYFLIRNYKFFQIYD